MVDQIPALFGRVDPAAWSAEILSISGIHATVTGVLAGFSIAVVVLLATLEERHQVTRDQNLLKQVTIGVFLVSFIGYISTATLYTVVVEPESAQQKYFLYAAASSLYHFSSVLAFLGLYPLFEIVMLHLLKTVATITLFGAVFGGFSAAAIPYQDLLRIRLVWIFSCLLVAAVVSVVALKICRRGQRSLLHDFPRVLYASCALIIIVFTMGMLMFFAPWRDIWERYLPIVALGILFASTVLSLFVPLFMLTAIRGAGSGPRMIR